MVGDGVNDAPALAAADASASPLGAEAGCRARAADIALMRNDLLSVVDAISLSRATLGKIRQNLFFAWFGGVRGRWSRPRRSSRRLGDKRGLGDVH